MTVFVHVLNSKQIIFCKKRKKNENQNKTFTVKLINHC